MSKGYIHLIPLIIIALIIVGGGVFLVKNKYVSLSGLSVTPFPTSSPALTSTPTLSPTLSPTPQASTTPMPTMTATPSPFPKPQTVSGPPGAGYSHVMVHTDKGDFSASILSIDLNSAKVKTDTANDSECANNCPVLSLSDFVSKNGGFAGVNGSYFCPSTYAECSSKSNSFDFPVYNSRLGKWINQGNLFWDGRSIIYFDGSGGHYMQDAKNFGGGLTAGIVNYPGLLNGGNVQIDDNQSGLSDKQKAKGTKVGIGLRGSKNVIIVIANNVNMQEFAYVFKSLSVDSALNLDTGGSTALYENGSYLAGPGRNIPNAIIFTR